MVDRQVVLETVKKMVDSGLEDSVIVSTLKDVGLNEKDITAFLAEAKGKNSAKPTSKEAVSTPATENDELPESPVSDLPDDREEENRFLHTTTHAALQESSGQLDQVLTKVLSMEEKIALLSNLPLKEFNEKVSHFDKKISELAKDMLEVKTQTQALREVLEKVLDTNRAILSELESKKN